MPRDERRLYPRMESPVLVEFAHPATKQPERSYTQDVSRGGMCFPTSVRLQVGQELPIRIEVPARKVDLHTLAHVVWVREIAHVGVPQYEVGVQFRWAEDPDRALFEQHLSSLLRHPV